MTNNEIRLHKEYTDWLLTHADSYTHAATLTLKPYRMLLTTKGTVRETLCAIGAQRNFRYFLTRLNTGIFGKAYKRFGKSVFVLPILEGDQREKQLHYHCAFGGFPLHLSNAGITQHIVSAWKLTPFGNEQVDIKPMRNAGWVSYMSKDIGKSTTVGVDLENTRLPNTLLD